MRKILRLPLATPKIRAGVSVGLTVAVLTLIAWRSDTAALESTLTAIKPTLLLLVLATLTTGALLAAARLKLVASDFGYDLGWREAIAAMSVGQIGGALFFQIAGQLMGRGAYLSRHGVPIEATVAMVGYERIVALGISLVTALAGAWYIFGGVAVDIERGGGELLKLIAGLLAAIAASAAVGWGRMAISAVRRLPAVLTVRRGIRTALITAGVHTLTLAAYVAIASVLGGDTPVGDIAAASLIVMFAASLPISIAGWGVREISSVVALSAVGVDPAAALVTSVLIGVGSISVVAVLAGLSLARSRQKAASVVAASRTTIDYAHLLSIAVPLTTAVLIFFQVHIPVGTGYLNINLADPFALLGGAFLVVRSTVYLRRWPDWRIRWMNAHLVSTVVVMTAALLIGAWRFGWTDWAVANRFIGWFVLLGYAAAGTLIVRSEGENGLRILLVSFAAAGSAIVVLDLLLLEARAFGLDIPMTLLTTQMAGFAGNPNAFGFQMLMVLAAVAAAVTAGTTSTTIMMLAVIGICFSISRATLLTLPFVIAAAVYMRALTARQIAVVLGGSAAFLIATMAINLITFGDADAALAPLKPPIYETDASTAERVQSLLGGLDLFLSHPIFGAGLGAQIESHIRTFGTPLVIHSTPVWLLAETGVVGFLIFAVPAVRVFLVEARRTARDSASVFLVLIVTALAVMSLAHELLYQRTFWFLFGAALACPARLRASTTVCDRSGDRQTTPRQPQSEASLM